MSKKNALGRPHGFADQTQGTLFFDVARIIDAKRPRAFMLENVRNLVSHDRGRTFEVIMRTLHRGTGLSRAGPGAGCLAAGAAGPASGSSSSGSPRTPGSTSEPLSSPPSRPTMSDVLHPQDGSEDPETPYTEGPKARVADKYTLTDHLWTYLQNYAAKHRSAGNGFGYGLVGPRRRGPHPVGQVLQGRLGDPCDSGRRQEPAPADAARDVPA